ncbi:hypothetical protein FB381_2834 [Nocardioides albertanoniae]|uniref:Lipoprotein n=1 Tax=Nocardioides albertanoniae TaxID=1175486 RepID=A0A543A8K5_9ACTN|nr:hypothetical protein [Nocardioides albertanoniae]TQL68933.1 hypothetical protein FB381_2834 [Nocardioides albertanoniae]
MMKWSAAALVLLLPVALTGCDQGQDAAVRESAEAFGQAVSAQDWARACQLLAPETRSEVESAAKSPCESALAEEDLSAPGLSGRAEVFGTTAQVRYRGGALFLTRFADGWRVLAADCAPQAPKPYDCTVHGG